MVVSTHSQWVLDISMARGGTKSGGSSTMGSIAAHEGEEEGKMKRSTGGGTVERKVPREKMDKAHCSSPLGLEMIILIGVVSFNKLTNC